MAFTLRRAGKIAAGSILAVVGTVVLGGLAKNYADVAKSTSPPQPGQHYFVPHGKGQMFPDLENETDEVKLTAAQTEGRYTIQDELWHPGFDVPPHFHKEHAEVFYLMDGQVEWTVGGETHLMSAGDLVYIPANTVHSVHVVGNKDAHMLFIYQPGGYEHYEDREESYSKEERKKPQISHMLREESDFNLANPQSTLPPQRGQHYFVLHGKGQMFPDLKDESVEVKLTAAQTEGRYTVQDELWHPGFDVPPHFHKEHAEVFYLMDGQLEWTVGGETHLMSAGDLVYIPANTVHSVHVVGNKDAHDLFIYQPGGYEHYEVREGSYSKEEREKPQIRNMLREESDFNPVNPQ